MVKVANNMRKALEMVLAEEIQQTDERNPTHLQKEIELKDTKAKILSEITSEYYQKKQHRIRTQQNSIRVQRTKLQKRRTILRNNT